MNDSIPTAFEFGWSAVFRVETGVCDRVSPGRCYRIRIGDTWQFLFHCKEEEAEFWDSLRKQVEDRKP